jgi:hypothetical protein
MDQHPGAGELRDEIGPTDPTLEAHTVPEPHSWGSFQGATALDRVNAGMDSGRVSTQTLWWLPAASRAPRNPTSGSDPLVGFAGEGG